MLNAIHGDFEEGALGLATEVKQDMHVKAPNLKKPETSD